MKTIKIKDMSYEITYEKWRNEVYKYRKTKEVISVYLFAIRRK